MKRGTVWLWAVLSSFVASEPYAAKAVATPDAVYVNGKIVTMDSTSSVAQAFAVRGDQIVAVGKNATISALASQQTRKVDLQGATVIPGLTDSHDHFWNAGKYMGRGVDLVGVVTLAEMQMRLRAAVAKAAPGEVVFTTTGWSVNPQPTRQDLDAISASVPIVVIAYRRGTAFFNSAAFARLGVTKAHPRYKGVEVPVDETGELSGTLPIFPTRVFMIDDLLPPRTAAEQDEVIRQAMRERNALGITSIRELAVWPSAIPAFNRMRNRGEFTVRVALGIEFPDVENTEQHLAELPPVNRDDPWLFLDSVAEEPWTPGSMSPANFTALVRAENRMGWRHAPHIFPDIERSIPVDTTVEATLSAYEAADRDSPLVGKRWYLEHHPFATPAQMERMARLGIVVSTQDMGYRPPNPAHIASLSPQRLDHLNPIREFLDHKIVVIGGSEYGGPTATDREPNNLMIPFYFYVTRKTVDGKTRAASEKISREEALRLFTVNAAYATFQEKKKGQIAPGMWADFVILNQDLMTVPDEKILETRPMATFVGGKKVYASPGSQL
jgi:predicted amidohydrolase YtcJ